MLEFLQAQSFKTTMNSGECMYHIYILMCWSECTFGCLHSERKKEEGVGFVLGFNVRTCCATSARWLIRVRVWWRCRGERRDSESDRDWERESLDGLNHSSRLLCWLQLRNLKSKEKYNNLPLQHALCSVTRCPTFLYIYCPWHIKQLWCNAPQLDSWFYILFLQ